GLVVLTAGCPSTQFAFLGGGGKDGPVQPAPPVEKLVGYLNDNSGRMQSVRYEDVTLTPIQGNNSFNLTADIMVQKPRNFRMMGRALGSPMVDLGSNDHEFWWWLGDPCDT